MGDAVPEDDVEQESDAVGEREHEAPRLGHQADVGQGVHPEDGQDQGQQVATGPRAEHRQDHRAEELDGTHSGQQ